METDKIKIILIEYLKETIVQVRTIAAQGGGTKVLGDVINRPDDLEIEIDRVGEVVLKNLLEKYGQSATVFSEPENGDIVVGEHPDFYGSLDPFDNSVLFLWGFQHSWYTVLSFFDEKKEFLCGAIGDILNNKAYVHDGESVFLLDLENDKKTPIRPSSRKSLAEPIVLASYIMSSQYSPKFLDVFGDLVKGMHKRGLLYPFGGAHIYGHLAAGQVDAYIMFDEPRSEIDPGFAIAKKAGCLIGEVDKDGNWKDYEFIPGKQHERVPFFVAVANPELRDEIISYYKHHLSS
ncbi:MAG: inositol monophosphatase family protein [bacterium]|nr:inositol monophosphatase family protein [bacterium]